MARSNVAFLFRRSMSLARIAPDTSGEVFGIIHLLRLYWFRFHQPQRAVRIDKRLQVLYTNSSNGTYTPE